MNRFFFTCGDVNGIGPEIIVKSLNQIKITSSFQIVFFCPQNVFEETLKIVPPNFSYAIIKNFDRISAEKGKVFIYDIGSVKTNYGKPTISSGKASYNAIIQACNFAKENHNSAIITAPISKYAFQKAGISFPGHTELLADYFEIQKFAMMFVSKNMKAGLITIHIPIKDIAQNLTKSKLENTVQVIYNSLRKDFSIKYPKIALLGLNPHAGEDGKIGREELELLKPLIKKNKNFLNGPFVPDAFFGNKLYKKYDCTIGLYHDQILIPFKLMNFNRGVNFTAGLPIVRTSPDHGTAFDIAGKGIANPESMIEAYNFAVKILKNRQIDFGNK